MKGKTLKKILAVLLCIGVLCALGLCVIRVKMEAANDRVAVVMTEQAAARIEGLPASVQLFDGGNFLSGTICLLVEDDSQYSYVPSPEIDAALSAAGSGADTGTAFVRCFHLTEKYAARYNYLGYSGAEEIENILYRAVTDRNIRVLWLEPFVDAQTGETVTDGAVYAQVLENLAQRMARHGLSLDTEPSLFPAFSPSGVLLLLMAFAAAAGGVWLLTDSFGLPGKWALGLLLVLCLCCAGILILRRTLAVQLFALAASVVFPCLAIQRAAQCLERAENAPLGRELAAFAGNFAQCFLIVLAGGLLVGAIQSGTRYLLAIDNFRGVKLSQIVPILFAVYVTVRRLCPLREILRGKKYILVLAVLLVLGGLGVYILRTGDGVLSVSTLEQRLRNWLEHVLLVRPRTKEFLVAWPCFGLAFALCARGARRYCWPFAILTAPGFASVVNTFCHSRAPIWVSTVRGLLGTLIGLALGLVLTALFHKVSGGAGQKNSASIDKN